MPGFLVERVLKRYNNSRKVIVYEGGVLAQDQKFLIQKMANAMGVSYSAFRIRLMELGQYEVRPVEEYLRSELHYGGDFDAGNP